MILYPAIDLKDGQCVRLLKGEMGQATVFNDDPAAQAKAFEAAGAEWVHLVDLKRRLRGAASECGCGRGDPGRVERAGATGRRHQGHGHHRGVAGTRG